MKTPTICILIATIFISNFACSKKQTKDIGNLSPGNYTGYGEFYTVKNGAYIICAGCEPLGVECNLQVSQKGVHFEDAFYPWTFTGIQAARAIKEGSEERIHFEGKFGGVTIVDCITTNSEGNIISLMRMSLLKRNE